MNGDGFKSQSLPLLLQPLRISAAGTVMGGRFEFTSKGSSMGHKITWNIGLAKTRNTVVQGVTSKASKSALVSRSNERKWDLTFGGTIIPSALHENSREFSSAVHSDVEKPLSHSGYFRSGSVRHTKDHYSNIATPCFSHSRDHPWPTNPHTKSTASKTATR